MVQEVGDIPRIPTHQFQNHESTIEKSVVDTAQCAPHSQAALLIIPLPKKVGWTHDLLLISSMWQG